MQYPKAVFDVCVYTFRFYICVGIDFVDLTVEERGFALFKKSLEICIDAYDRV